MRRMGKGERGEGEIEGGEGWEGGRRRGRGRGQRGEGEREGKKRRRGRREGGEGGEGERRYVVV